MNEEGHSISLRTLYRDLNKIEEDFGQTITKNKIDLHGKKVTGYKIDVRDSCDYDDVLSLINMWGALKIIKKELGAVLIPAEYISIGRGWRSGGVVWLNTLIEAMIKSRMVHFTYVKYGSSESSERFVEPYFLKSYNQVWYLMAKEKDFDQIKVFGLDRVTNVSLSTVTFQRNAQFNPANLFKDSIGITVKEHKEVKRITIDITEPFSKKIKSIPLHQSQRIIQDVDGRVRIELSIVPNSEFYSEIIKMRHYAKIISPNDVRDRMKEIIRSMAENYT